MACLGSFTAEHNIGWNGQTSLGLLNMCMCVLEKKSLFGIHFGRGPSVVRMNEYELVYDGFSIVVSFSHLV